MYITGKTVEILITNSPLSVRRAAKNMKYIKDLGDNMKKINEKFFRFYDEIFYESWVFTLDGVDEFDEDFYYDNILPKMEARDLEIKYGFHDFDTRGDDMIYGYFSCEVERDKIPDLMEEWREIFKECGIGTGSVVVYKGEVI
jgi:hypothetical protein